MEISSYPSGAFCFPELNTRDVEAAKRFYGPVLGWTTFDVPSAAGSYSLARVNGKDVAGIHLASGSAPGLAALRLRRQRRSSRGTRR